MEETKEKVLQRESNGDKVGVGPISFESIDPHVQTAIKCAAEKKAFDIVALDLREIASFTEYFVIVSGGNQRQAQAISDEIEEQLRKEGVRPVRIEGFQTAEWILLDFGDFVVHVFDKDARGFYDLERLWRDAGRVAIPSDI
jgi:ribosome-associated protein